MEFIDIFLLTTETQTTQREESHFLLTSVGGIIHFQLIAKDIVYLMKIREFAALAGLFAASQNYSLHIGDSLV